MCTAERALVGNSVADTRWVPRQNQLAEGAAAVRIERGAVALDRAARKMLPSVTKNDAALRLGVRPA